MTSGIWRVAVVAHRYLGMAVGFMVLVWFGSGIVMMYVGYPELSTQDRLRSLSPINWQACCNLAEIGFEDNQQFDRVAVESVLGRPVLRLARPPLPEELIDLATGHQMDVLDATTAEAIVRDAAPRIHSWRLLDRVGPMYRRRPDQAEPGWTSHPIVASISGITSPA